MIKGKFTICTIRGNFKRIPSRFKVGDIVWHDVSDDSHPEYVQFKITRVYRIRSWENDNPWFYEIQSIDTKTTAGFSHVSEIRLYKENPLY